jgi:hypothetical protein
VGQGSSPKKSSKRAVGGGGDGGGGGGGGGAGLSRFVDKGGDRELQSTNSDGYATASSGEGDAEAWVKVSEREEGKGRGRNGERESKVDEAPSPKTGLSLGKAARANVVNAESINSKDKSIDSKNRGIGASPRPAGTQSEKVLTVVMFYRKCTRALTFQISFRV